MFSGRYLLLLAAMTPLIAALQPANLRAQSAQSALSSQRVSETQKEKINAGPSASPVA